MLASVLRPVYDYPGETESGFAHWLATPIDLASLGAGDLLVGHYTAPAGLLCQRYPAVFGDSRYRLITVLREPWAWFCSVMRYFGPEGCGCRSGEEASTRLAGLYSRVLASPVPIGQDALRAYWFVGTTECIQTTADQLMHALRKSPQPLQAVNISGPHPYCVPRKSLAGDYLSAAAGDVALYRSAVTRSRTGGLMEDMEAS